METYSREAVVNKARSWLGKNVADGSYKMIIDIYNSYTPRARGIKMQYDWQWCACTWSAVAISLGYSKIMPIEISCGNLVELAKKAGIWQENDSYIPKPADAILYDWEDSGVGDNTSWPDHIGIVEEVYPDAGYFTTIEGNWGKKVSRRTISINGKTIRGFITPKYTDDNVNPSVANPNKTVSQLAHEVIAGKWGSGADRKKRLESFGYNYTMIQAEVNRILNEPSKDSAFSKAVTATCKAKVTDKNYAGNYTATADLHCRNDAGNNKKSLCVIPKGTQVSCDGSYTTFNGAPWYLVSFNLNGTRYTGFSHSSYLKKVK